MDYKIEEDESSESESWDDKTGYIKWKRDDEYIIPLVNVNFNKKNCRIAKKIYVNNFCYYWSERIDC